MPNAQSMPDPQLIFGQIDPDSPMNEFYYTQVEMHARRNPQNQHAQAMYAYWTQAMLQTRPHRQQPPGLAGGQPMTQGTIAPSTSPFAMPPLATGEQGVRSPVFH